ncbi:D-ribose pyranase [Ignatzschineria ureiclastica]|uniref:D-ribose pyranase n=1 Tax=Ignatzschineria ureiclastica TaxID=472582 RepID=A0A2U2AG16_9GAMM|nr:D-ribose pyranase [Ignatzschineria ureiclastica]PWD81595.1 D-ribose pyranase [Ignatzschineria ureiclastica]GHA01917.1 D-ribose pyranase [Ignatzschineria ureiclastica]
MIKSKLLNSDIHRILAQLGHTDRIVIGDAGLPIPSQTERIDLALVAGVPSFMETLEAVGPLMQIETILLADEIKVKNPDLHNAILAWVETQSSEEKPIMVDYITHEALKAQSGEPACKTIIRTGECSPYANIILEAGVVF